MRTRRGWAGLLVTALLVSGCGGSGSGPDQGEPDDSPAAGASYSVDELAAALPEKVEGSQKLLRECPGGKGCEPSSAGVIHALVEPEPDGSTTQLFDLTAQTFDDEATAEKAYVDSRAASDAVAGEFEENGFRGTVIVEDVTIDRWAGHIETRSQQMYDDSGEPVGQVIASAHYVVWSGSVSVSVYVGKRGDTGEVLTEVDALATQNLEQYLKRLEG